MIDWQDLVHLASLARTGSLSAAARELGVDHATVGRRIASLERTLDLRLIDRLPRSSPLTTDGRAIAELVSGMQDAVEAIRRYAKSSAAAPSTTIRISAPPSVAARLIAPNVVAFHKANPEITMALHGATGNLALDRGEADIAVRMTRPEDADLLVRRIGAMRFGLYATAEVAAQPAEGWSFIGYDAAHDHLTQQIWLRSLLAGRAIVFQASDVFGQLEAARAGLGVVALPRFLGDVDPILIRLPTASPSLTRDLWLVTYPDLRRSPAIRSVMDFLARIIGDACRTRE
ncbi:LysR family transcriptional regulator [Rhizobium tubonense]|uniref:LysR family transcriptional regulator n=1 Tax=Rhizobium tubonense TaxID=484088 RepID=A0A2W4CHU8_9HYPH|nr:LysR family transcriptional regulator [Rhizobium tubonense]PZM12261.1 LysR family transcriptional regulator [Rhizobium tubonense]